MAIGDQAKDAGFNVVPDTGEEGRVRWGGREINRTRDYIAQTKALIPVGRDSYRAETGITSGTAAPTGGNDGDIYFRIIN